MRVCQIVDRDRRSLHWPQQANTAFDGAVVLHQTRRRHLYSGTTRLSVDQELRVAITCPLERFGQRERPVAVATRDREQARFGAALRMGVERAAIGDDEALGHD